MSNNNDDSDDIFENTEELIVESSCRIEDLKTWIQEHTNVSIPNQIITTIKGSIVKLGALTTEVIIHFFFFFFFFFKFEPLVQYNHHFSSGSLTFVTLRFCETRKNYFSTHDISSYLHQIQLLLLFLYRTSVNLKHLPIDSIIKMISTRGKRCSRIGSRGRPVYSHMPICCSKRSTRQIQTLP